MPSSSLKCREFLVSRKRRYWHDFRLICSWDEGTGGTWTALYRLLFIQYPDNCLVIIAAIDGYRFVHPHSFATRISTTRITCLLLYMHIFFFFFFHFTFSAWKREEHKKKDGDLYANSTSIWFRSTSFYSFFFPFCQSLGWMEEEKKRHPFWLAFRRGFCSTVYKSILPQLGTRVFFFLSFFLS
jgi:hypothetical protein